MPRSGALTARRPSMTAGRPGSRRCVTCDDGALLRPGRPAQFLSLGRERVVPGNPRRKLHRLSLWGAARRAGVRRRDDPDGRDSIAASGSAGCSDLDVVGHYARPDVFRLQVDETPKRSVSALPGGPALMARRAAQQSPVALSDWPTDGVPQLVLRDRIVVELDRVVLFEPRPNVGKAVWVVPGST